jgi:hypothetical protein
VGWVDPGFAPGEAQQSTSRWRKKSRPLLGFIPLRTDLQELPWAVNGDVIDGNRRSFARR